MNIWDFLVGLGAFFVAKDMWLDELTTFDKVIITLALVLLVVT